MTSLNQIVAARRGGTTLSLRDLLMQEHRKRHLLIWLHRAATEAFLIDQARAFGLRVEDVELQEAADLFRRRRNLLSAADSKSWLSELRLTVEDLEATLEQELLLEKLKSHVAGDGVAERFRADPAKYDRIRLRQILVLREDLARELLSQITDEGADFGELARNHSQHASSVNRGDLGVMLRKQLPPQLHEALASARPDAVVDPSAAPEGYLLVLVEELSSGESTPEATTHIREELYQEWLEKQLDSAPFDPVLLDVLA